MSPIESEIHAFGNPPESDPRAVGISQNATQGQRNEVSATRLLDAEVSEAWREAAGDYATIVMRYESIDVMRDRATNAIVTGSATAPSETTELWTFVRAGGDERWKLSAIQES